MKFYFQIICCLLLLSFVFSVDAQTIGKPKLRKQLLERLEKDQKIRNEIPDDPAKITPEYIARLRSIDQANTRWMKKVIRKYGFPTKDMVCDDGTYAAFILVQHADREPDFQKLVLPLLEKAVRAKQAEGFYYAYLTDRILTAENKLQRFGSQLKIEENGKIVPYPIEDEVNVDKRRAEIGLPPMSEYIQGKQSLVIPRCNKKLSQKE